MSHTSSKLIAGYRGTVDTWECDQMKHMNVQFYSSRASASLAHLLNALGLSPARIREERRALKYRDLRIQYMAEMHVGAQMYGVSGVRAVKEDSIQAFTHLYNAVDDTLSSVSEFNLVYQDLDNGEILNTPLDVLEAAKKLEDPHEDLYCPAPIKSVVMAAKKMEHMFETSRSAVDVWECDAFGNIEISNIIARFSDAASHIMGSVGITRAMQRERNLGSAALDYYTEFLRPIRMADSLVLKSGLLDRRPKNFAFGHHLINCDTDEIVNCTTVIGCYFDMTARKSVPLPPEYSSVPDEKLLKNQL
ncbi:acyl-CoA thioesterase [Sneathiella glossodoripedis]|uniref:acyl-CoA thioesterase n=1 Tax=Sneathiella glossodoripedis TaxID=418853 RepID=UPI00046F740C|nr:thioesterase family protein [Sneathiella glossodoripedis]